MTQKKRPTKRKMPTKTRRRLVAWTTPTRTPRNRMTMMSTTTATMASAAALPLDRLIAFDGMHFAWYAFYPELTYVN